MVQLVQISLANNVNTAASTGQCVTKVLHENLGNIVLMTLWMCAANAPMVWERFACQAVPKI